MRTPALLFLLVGFPAIAVQVTNLVHGYNHVTNFTLVSLHNHSLGNFSFSTPDPAGNHPLADVCKHYGDTNSFGAYAITEHDQLSTNATVPHAAGVFIQGQEVTRSNHTVALFIRSKIAGGYPNQDLGTPQQVIDDIVNQGGIACLAHPNTTGYRWRTNDAMAVTGYQYIEVNNALSYDLYGVGDAVAEDVWDYVLTAGRRVLGYCGQDMHISYLTNGYNQIYLTTTNEANIKDALLNGNLTFGRDHKMRVSVTNWTVYAHTYGVSSRFDWIKNGATNRSTTSATSDSYTMDGTETYVRVKASKTGEASAVAYSQPIFVVVTNLAVPRVSAATFIVK